VAEGRSEQSHQLFVLLYQIDYSQDPQWITWRHAGIQKILSREDGVDASLHYGGTENYRPTNNVPVIDAPQAPRFDSNPFSSLPIAFPPPLPTTFEESARPTIMDELVDGCDDPPNKVRV
jgi:hypothetical protein